jgi:hypothetical protein
MLAELFRYWTTFAPERVRKYGYLRRLIALEFQHKRNEHAWQEHVMNCRTFIAESAEKCPRHKIAVVLGSGLLLEVPLRTLADHFERVYLVDMFHMPQVRAEVKKYLNVKMLYGDITGIFAMMAEGEYPGDGIPAPAARIPHLNDADFIVSANCLTHLAPPFCDYLGEARYMTEFDQDKLTLQIMDAHVGAIVDNTPAVSAIITDTERFVLAGNRVVRRKSLIPGFRWPDGATLAQSLEWQWLISPAGNRNDRTDIEHTVVTRLYEHLAPAEDEDQGDGLEDDDNSRLGEAMTDEKGSLGDGLEDV